ncbi:xanthine dehydrogenase family protein subunit M [Roseovarius spongiae]|uniref:Xanthine dehydrogenase family protein subunit M n=2 Tax=Roseovarius spongiae TaxID=2320272 RepID=A0A3A8B2C2_9RHOB|nr:xanthine dehydrogenase family protein subunit M [Roseovarius spongiae]
MTEALDILARGPVTLAAGCTDLFAATGARALPGPVLDITGVDALRCATRDADGVHIGAATTWSDLVAADLPPAFDMLKQAAVEVGSLQIQNAATLAGNICNASPAADGAPCLLALDAEVELASASGARRMPLAAFVTGPRQTALAPGEMVTGLHVPADATRGISRFEKLGARRYLVISIAMVAARLVIEQGRIAGAAIAVGACSAVAVRLTALEAALIGAPADARLAAVVTDALIRPALAPIDDIRADAAYRMDAAAELVRRALAELVAGS